MRGSIEKRLTRMKKFIVCECVETREMVDFLAEEECDEL